MLKRPVPGFLGIAGKNKDEAKITVRGVPDESGEDAFEIGDAFTTDTLAGTGIIGAITPV